MKIRDVSGENASEPSAVKRWILATLRATLRSMEECSVSPEALLTGGDLDGHFWIESLTEAEKQ